MPLIAYYTGTSPAPEIVPASFAREWMQRTFAAYAQRCLPLLMANQAGWWIINRVGFRARWDGSTNRAGVAIESIDGGQAPPEVGSQFGYGIVTWTIPYLFRTPSGYNLLARGPANLPKAGAVALEGIIETDWAVATFTMNWQLTDPGREVTFAAGEPFAMIIPQRRHELEEFRPELRPIDADEALATQYRTWEEERELHRVLRAYAVQRHGADSPDAKSWQGDYFRGTSPGGVSASEHQTRLALRSFRPNAPADGAG